MPAKSAAALAKKKKNNAQRTAANKPVVTWYFVLGQGHELTREQFTDHIIRLLAVAKHEEQRYRLVRNKEAAVQRAVAARKASAEESAASEEEAPSEEESAASEEEAPESEEDHLITEMDVIQEVVQDFSRASNETRKETEGHNEPDIDYANIESDDEQEFEYESLDDLKKVFSDGTDLTPSSLKTHLRMLYDSYPTFQVVARDQKVERGFEYMTWLQFHWYVTCLEGPGDINLVIKLKDCSAISRSSVMRTYMLLQSKEKRVEDDASDDESAPQYANYPVHKLEPHSIQIDAVRTVNATLKYLFMATNSNNHKLPSDTDQAPIFSGGVVEFAAKDAEQIMRHFVTDPPLGLGYRMWAQVEANPWFKNTAMSFISRLTKKRFDDQVEAYLNETRVCEVSSAERRLEKLTAPGIGWSPYVETEDGQTMHPGLKNLYELLEYNSVDAVEFRRKVLLHLCTNRAEVIDEETSTGNALKAQLTLVGHPGCGKSALLRSILEMLTVCNSPSADGKTKWASMREQAMYSDVILVPELQKAIDKGFINEAEMVIMYENTGKFICPYIKFPPYMPILSMTQSSHVQNIGDLGSWFERIDIVHMYNPIPLPKEEGNQGKIISKQAMSYFLTAPADEVFGIGTGGWPQDEKYTYRPRPGVAAKKQREARNKHIRAEVHRRLAQQEQELNDESDDLEDTEAKIERIVQERREGRLKRKRDKISNLHRLRQDRVEFEHTREDRD